MPFGYVERVEKVQRVPGRKFVLPARLFLSVLHDLLHEVFRGLGRFALLLPGGVGVGAEGEAGIKVPQHGEGRFHATPFCRAVVANVCLGIVESEMLQSGVLQDFLVKIHHAVWVVLLPSQGRREQIRIIWMVVILLDQQVHRGLWDRHQLHRVFWLVSSRLLSGFWMYCLLIMTLQPKEGNIAVPTHSSQSAVRC